MTAARHETDGYVTRSGAIATRAGVGGGRWRASEQGATPVTVVPGIDRILARGPTPGPIGGRKRRDLLTCGASLRLLGSVGLPVVSWGFVCREMCGDGAYR